MICRAANTLWLAGCAPEAARYRRATLRVGREQERVLRRLLHDNADTEFGRRHRFPRIRSVREYQASVPLATYEDVGREIDRIADGVPNVLTREPVRLLEPTSGSTDATKLIPYTRSLQREFQRGIRAWIADLFWHEPALMAGPAYWSASPMVTASRRSHGGIPIGFDDDASYVGGWQQRLVAAVMAVPAAVRHVADMDAFRYTTLLALVRCADLRLMSVWNPTFLTLLVDRLPACGDALAHDLRTDPRRAAALRAALGAATPGERHAILWPELRAISCWTDAGAAAPAAHLATLFPHARIRGKGLIATEAFISLPLDGHPGSALAVRSHFLEFAPVDARNQRSSCPPALAHQLERGQRYAVVVSTGGGLYRYQLDDVVEVIDHLGDCPLVRFVGRRRVCDFFGEKLNDAYVTGVLRETLDACAIVPAFVMLACDDTLSPPAYVLYIETETSADLLERLRRGVEARLRAAFHYDYARCLGQLAPLRVFRAAGAGVAHLDAAIRRGQRAGNVKPGTLDHRTEWSQILQGEFIPRS